MYVSTPMLVFSNHSCKSRHVGNVSCCNTFYFMKTMIVISSITQVYIFVRYNSFKWMDKTGITNHLAMFDIAIEEIMTKKGLYRKVSQYWQTQ